MFTIGQTASYLNVSVKALRYYDRIDLLKPDHIGDNGYRYYSQENLSQLALIILFKSMGITLKDIKNLLAMNSNDLIIALSNHIKDKVNTIATIEKEINLIEETIRLCKKDGGILMKDTKEKLEKMLRDNEEKYGKEVREKYGEESVAAFNDKFRNLTSTDLERIEHLNAKIQALLVQGVSRDVPLEEEMKELAQVHKAWLGIYAPKGLDLDQYQQAMVEMYLADDRFKAYYERIIPGACQYLYDAVQVSQAESTTKL